MASLGIDDLPALLSRKDFAAALRVIEAELRGKPRSFSLRRQHAEVLGLAGRAADAAVAWEALFRLCVEEGQFARARALLPQLRRSPGADVEAMRKDLAEKEAQANRFAEAIRRPPARRATIPFRGVPEKAVPELLERAVARSCAPGEVVYEEGAEGASMFLIQEGSVRVDSKRPDGTTVQLTILPAGECFGQVAVLTGRPRVATVTAREGTLLLEISKAGVEDVISRHADLKEFLERKMRDHAALAAAALKG